MPDKKKLIGELKLGYDQLTKDVQKINQELAKLNQGKDKIDIDVGLKSADVSLDKLVKRYSILKNGSKEFLNQTKYLTDEYGKQKKILEIVDKKTGNLVAHSQTLTSNYKLQRDQQQKLADLKERSEQKAYVRGQMAKIKEVAERTRLEKKAQDEAEKLEQKRYVRSYTAAIRNIEKRNAAEKKAIEEQNALYQQQFQSALQARQGMNILGGANTMGSGDARASVIGKMLNSAIYTTAYYGYSALVNTVNEASEANKNYELGLVDLSRTLENVTQTSLKKYGEQAIQFSKDFSIPLQEVQSAMTELARAGVDNKDDLMAMTNAVLMGLNTTEINSAAEMTGYLVSAVKQLGMEFTDSMSIIDGWNKMADKYAVQSNDFAEAIQKAGSASKTLGLNINDINAMVVMLGEATQASGHELGQALKSLEVRLLRPETVKTLESYGIAVKKDAEHFLSFQQIMENVNNATNNLADDSVQLNDIMNALGGTWRRNWAQILAQDWGRFEQLSKESVDSFGYSVEENEKVLQTFEAQIQRFKSTMAEVYISIGQDGGVLDQLKGLLQGASSVANAFAKSSPELKKFLVILAEVTVGAKLFSMSLKGLTGVGVSNWLQAIIQKTQLFNTTQQTSARVTKMLNEERKLGNITKKEQAIIMEMVNTKMGVANVKTSALNTAQKAMTTTQRGLTLSSLALNAALTAGMIGITLIVSAIANYVNKQKEMKQEIKDTATEVSNQEKSLVELLSKYEELNSLQVKDESARQELKTVQKDLIELLELEKKGIDLVNDARGESIKKIKEESIEKLKANRDALQAVYNLAKEEADKKVYDYRDKIKAGWRIGDSADIQKNLGLYGNETARKLIDFGVINLNIKEVTDRLNQLIDLTNQYGDNTTKQFTKIVNIRDEYQKILDAESDALINLSKNEALQSVLTAQSEISTLNKDNFEKFKEIAIETLAKQKGLNEVTDDYKKTIYNLIDDMYPELSGKIKGIDDDVSNTTSVFYDYAQAVEEANKALDNTQSSLKSLAGLYYQVAEGQEFNADQMLDLIQQHPKILDYMDQEGNLLISQQDLLKTLFDLKKQDMIMTLEAEKEKSDAVINSLESQRKAYLEFYETSVLGYTEEQAASMFNFDKEKYNDAEKNSKEYAAKILALQNIVFDTFKPGSSSAKAKEVYEIQINQFQELEDALSIINYQLERNNILTDMASEENKIALLSERIGLLKQEQKALHDINEARRSAISQNVSKLSSYGLNIDYDAPINSILIKNYKDLDTIAKQYAKTKKMSIEDTNDFVKSVEQLVKETLSLNDVNRKSSNDYIQIDSNVQKLISSIKELSEVYSVKLKKSIEDNLKLLRDYEKETFNIQEQLLEKAKSEIDSLKSEKQALKDELVELIKDNILEPHQKKIDENEKSIKDKEKLLNAEIELLEKRIKAKESIIESIKETYQPEISALEELIKLQEEKNNQLDREKELQEKLSDLAKQRELIGNIQKQRNIKIIRADGSTEYISDSKRLEEEQDRLKKMEDDFSKWKRDRELDDLKQRLKTLEENRDIEIKGYQDSIDANNKSIKVKQDNWEKEKKVYQEKIDAANEEIERIQNVWELEKGTINERIKKKEEEIKTIQKAIQTIINLASAGDAQVQEELKQWAVQKDTLDSRIGKMLDEIVVTQNVIDTRKSELSNMRDYVSGMIDEYNRLAVAQNQPQISNSVTLPTTPRTPVKSESDNSSIIEQMKSNSAAWHTASDLEKKRLENENKSIGESMGWNRRNDGIWYKPDGTRAYDKGGLAIGKGWLKKDTVEPERVLSPQSTRSFDRLVEIMDRMPELRTPIPTGLFDLRELAEMLQIPDEDQKQGETHIYNIQIDKVETENAESFVDLIPSFTIQYKK